MGRCFFKIYQFIESKKLLSFGIISIIIFALFFIASNIQFEEDITKLIPKNKINSNLQKVLKTINFNDKIVVNISRRSDGSVDDLTQYAEELIDSITKNSGYYINKIQGKVNEDDIQNSLEFVYENLPLFLDEVDYKKIEKILNKSSIDSITLKNYKTLISPSGIIAKKSIRKDPLGLSFMALEKLQQLNFGEGFILHNNFLISKDKNHLLLFITPSLESNETAKNKKFVDNLYQSSNYLNKIYKGKVQSEYFGSTLIAVANANQIKNDIQLTVGIAITILLIILIYFYKKIQAPIILFLPAFFGGLCAIALLYIIRTKISAISLGVGSVLLGVTLDYSLHILTHIRKNNNIRSLYNELTEPILISSVTTSLAFMCLFFLDSEVLQDLAIFTATSVIGASFFALIFIPHLYNENINIITNKNIIDKISVFPIHKKKWVIVTLLILFFISFFKYNNVVFNTDLEALNYESQHIKDARLRLDNLINSNSKSIYLASFGNNENDAININYNVLKKLQHLKNNSEIINFSSISTLINPENIQKQKIARWNLFWTPQIIESTKYNLIESGKKLGFKPESFNLFYSLLNSDFKPLEIQDYKRLKMISIDDYISNEKNFTTISSSVKIIDSNTSKIVEIFNDIPNVIVINRKEMNETLLGNIKDDFKNLIVYSFIIVFLILLVYYRSISISLVTSIPICLTWLLTMGILGGFYAQFNIFSIIIATFIFGLCIDYSIFISNGLLKEYRVGAKNISIAKTSIFLSAITTILGFGVLILAKHPALNSISIPSIIGIFSAIVISFTLQPIFFKLFIGSSSRRPNNLRLLIHSFFSFIYFGFGSIFLTAFIYLTRMIPISKKYTMNWYHKMISMFMKSVLYTNPFVSKKIFNNNEFFERPGIIIANHTSFLDILTMGMIHPKIIFLVNDWVYNSPIFGKGVQLIGNYPVSNGLEKAIPHLRKKIDQGYTLMTFPEGTRSLSNKINRFHKGAFYIAEKLKLDIIPILIHGNSEVLSKGSFIIRDGSITVKILDRIKLEKRHLENNYSKITKKVRSYFIDEFKKFRMEVEKNDYFHKLILEDYKYKGDSIYNFVCRDIKTYEKIYRSVIDFVDSKDSIIHLSKDYGQLDYLLALDSADRKIVVYFQKNNIRKMVENSFIRKKYNNKMICEKTIQDAMKHEANVIIVDLNFKKNELLKLIKKDFDLLILLKENLNLVKEITVKSNFEKKYQCKDLAVLKRKNYL